MNKQSRINFNIINIKKQLPFIIGHAVLLLSLLILNGYSLKFMNDLKDSMNKSEKTLQNLFILEEKLFDSEKNINQVITTLNGIDNSSSLDSDLLKQAHQFSVVKAVYSALAKVKNGFNIKPELQIIAQYDSGSIKNLVSQIEGLDLDTTSNLDIYNILKAIANSTDSNITHTDKTDSSNLFDNINLLKITKIKDAKVNDIIIAAGQAIESNDIEKAFNLLHPLSQTYTEIQSLIPIIQNKKSANELLAQILENIMHNK